MIEQNYLDEQCCQEQVWLDVFWYIKKLERYSDWNHIQKKYEVLYYVGKKCLGYRTYYRDHACQMQYDFWILKKGIETSVSW